MESRTNELATEKTQRLLARYAIPSVIAMLVGSLYNMVDQIFIGWGVGYLGNAATNVAYPFTTICLALSLLFGIGSSALYNLSLGAGNEGRAGKTVGTALSALTLSSIILTVVSEIFVVDLLSVFGATNEVMPYALAYMRTVILGFPALIISNGMAALIRADGSPRYSMLSTLVGALVNTVLDPLFIFGFDMGMFGAALATIIGQYCSLFLVLIYLGRFKCIRFSIKSLSFNGRNLSRICSLGMSNSLNQVAITVVQITMNNLFVTYGALSVYGSEIPLAASGIVMKVNSLLVSVIVGISQGNQPILSFNYGKGSYERVRESFYVALKVSLVISVLAFILCQVFPYRIISVFGDGDALYFEFAVRFMRLFMMFASVNCVHVLSSNFFSAIGKPKMGVLLSLIRQVIFLIPLLFILSAVYGLDGLIWATPVSDTITFVLSIALSVKKKKKMSGPALSGQRKIRN